MQWWDDVVAWVGTDEGRLVLFSGAVPFVAILTAGLLAAWIARGSVRRVLARRDRDSRAAVIGLLVDSARQASVWSSSSTNERVLIERAVGEADLALRLLPERGARLAAEWAAHEIAGLKRASAVFSLDLDQPLADFRDRLVAWHRRPRRARRLFESDLLRWRKESEIPAAEATDLLASDGQESEGAESPPRTAQVAGAVPSRKAAFARAPLADELDERGEPGQVEKPTAEEFVEPVGAASRTPSA
jgi:hypothetical protein